MPTLPKAPNRYWIPKKNIAKRQYDNSNFYQSKLWRTIRNFYIQSNPLCESCNRSNKVTAAQCVDHIKPISQGGHKTDTSNLQSLCNPCHAKKSSREGVEYRRNIRLR